MSKYNDTFQPETFYHIFNRAISSERLFQTEENSNFFMGRIQKYLMPYFDFYAYCLLPNHFHFVVKTKSFEEWNEHFKKLNKSVVVNSNNFHKHNMLQCSKLIISYSKSYNKFYNRKGSLFIENIKRIELPKNSDILSAVFYVHKNPVHHGYAQELVDWNNCSYASIKHGRQDELIITQSVLDLFGGLEEFDKVHSQFLYK